MKKTYYFNSIAVCKQCNGDGKLMDMHHIGHGNYSEPNITTCDLCDGEGVVCIEKEIKVTITPKKKIRV